MKEQPLRYVILFCFGFLYVTLLCPLVLLLVGRVRGPVLLAVLEGPVECKLILFDIGSCRHLCLATCCFS